MLFLGAQTNTCKGHVISYSIWYETTHHQLPETWSKYLHNVDNNVALDALVTRVQVRFKQTPKTVCAARWIP